MAGYRIEREVGRGAMAVVYRAQQVNLQRPVALKILTLELAKDREYVVRFFNEARAAAALSHPHIIQAYDAGVADGGIYYFAMEYVEGDTLLRRIEREGSLKYPVALGVAADIAAALDYGWQKQTLTHGDIKPENIMLDSSGQTKLADFGLAKVAEHDFEGDGVMLTPLYAAPEVIRGQGAKGDCRSDIYSYGATLYHMLTGVPPFPGDDPRDVMRRHVEEKVIPPAERNPAVPQAVSDFVVALLAKVPGERPPDWQSVCKTLAWLRSRKVQKLAVARPAGSAKRKGGSGRRLALVFLLVVAALAAVGLYVFRALNPSRGDGRRAGGEPPLGSTASAETEWVQLKGRLAGTRENPELCVRMLENFGERYAQNAPQELTWYLQRYREMARQAAAPTPTATAPETPTAADLGARIDTVDTAVQGASPDRQALLAQIQALLQEKTLTPSQRERLQSLQAKVEHLQATEPGPGPKPPPEATAGPGMGDAPASPAEAEAKTRADAYADLMGAISQFEYAFDRSPEPLLREANRWLGQYTTAAPERERAEFLATRVLPALEEYLPKLVARKDKLVGQTLQTRKYGKVTVKDADAAGLKLAAKTQYGEQTMRMPWTELDRPTLIGAFGKLGFGEAGMAADDRRPYLAHLWLSRSTKALDGVLDTLPREDSEVRLWRAVRDDLEQAPRETKALAAWRAAQEAFLKDESVRANAKLQELKAESTAVGTRYEREIADLLAKTQGRVPSLRAAELVREAQAQADASPAEAVARCVTVQARYGLLDFAERAVVDRLRERATEALADEVRGPVRRDPLAHFLCPLYLADLRLRPEAVLYLAREMSTDTQAVSGPAAQQIPVLRGLALLEAGDWGGAQKALASEIAPATLEALPPALQVSILAAKGLVAERFEDNPKYAGAALLPRLQRVRFESGLPPAAAAVAAEVGLLTHTFGVSPEPWPPWTDLASQQQPPQMRRFVLSALAWLVESDAIDKAVTHIRRVSRSETTLATCGFTPGEGPILEAYADYLDAGTVFSALPSKLVADPVSERYLRLLTTCLAAKLPEDAEFEARALEALTRVLPGHSTTQGASAWFDAVLLQCRRALAAHDRAGVAAVVERALAVHSGSVAAYYPRLRALEAGAELLAGRRAMAQETLGFVSLSPVAAKSEQAWGKLFERDDAGRTVPKEITPGSESFFWWTWLAWAQQVGAAQDAEAVRALGRLGTARLSQAQRRLAETMRTATPDLAQKELTARPGSPAPAPRPGAPPATP